MAHPVNVAFKEVEKRFEYFKQHHSFFCSKNKTKQASEVVCELAPMSYDDFQSNIVNTVINWQPNTQNSSLFKLKMLKMLKQVLLADTPSLDQMNRDLKSKLEGAIQATQSCQFGLASGQSLAWLGCLGMAATGYIFSDELEGQNNEPSFDCLLALTFSLTTSFTMFYRGTQTDDHHQPPPIWEQSEAEINQLANHIKRFLNPSINNNSFLNSNYSLAFNSYSLDDNEEDPSNNCNQPSMTDNTLNNPSHP